MATARLSSWSLLLPSIADQHEYNISKSELYEGEAALSSGIPSNYPVRYIAYYLPQFHAIPENDKAWGAGFTEWTNVTKALPRYLGHYQPRLPSSLGFYNLTDVETLKQQVSLARRGGIFGFCIHHYWFSGVEVLDAPLKIILDNPDIDFPFCLDWANENWSKRWDGSENEIILEQRHEPDDGSKFATSLIRAVKDPRYIKIDGRPLLMIYRPNLLPDPKGTIAQIRDVFRREGMADPYILMPFSALTKDPNRFGVDGVAGFPPHNVVEGLPNQRRLLPVFEGSFAGTVLSYDDVVAASDKVRPVDFSYFPGVFPNWDNEARRPRRSLSFHGSTPRKYGRWLEAASKQAIAAVVPDKRIVFINAWNEWAEGAYLEPDRHFGFAYLAETRRCLDALSNKKGAPNSMGQSPALAIAHRFQAKPSRRHLLWNISRDVLRRLRRYVGSSKLP